jgi:hypothetical protein
MFILGMTIFAPSREPLATSPRVGRSDLSHAKIAKPPSRQEGGPSRIYGFSVNFLRFRGLFILKTTAHILRAFAPSREPLAPSRCAASLIYFTQRREGAKKESQL